MLGLLMGLRLAIICKKVVLLNKNDKNSLIIYINSINDSNSNTNNNNKNNIDNEVYLPLIKTKIKKSTLIKTKI